MNKVLVLLAIAVGSSRSVNAQHGSFTIKGKIGTFNSPAKVYLDYSSEGKSISDSCALFDGTFKFTGQLKESSGARMTFSRTGNKNKEIYGNPSGDVIYPHFGPENIVINSADSLYNAEWKGSKVHDEMIAFEKQVGPGIMTINHNNAAGYSSSIAGGNSTGYALMVETYRSKRGKNLLDFAQKNPASYFALQALIECVNAFSVSEETALPIFNKFSKELKESYAGREFFKRLSRRSVVGSNGKLKSDAPPKYWQEHWFEHDQKVDLVYYDDHVAFYYDNQMDSSVTWPFKTLSDSWAYIKKTYGAIGPSDQLYVIFHQARYGGGHPANYYDASHDYRNTLDCGLWDWSSPTGQQIGMPLHEIGHIVCSATNGMRGAPSDVIWGDSKFMEIFVYDVLLNIGRTDEADRVYQQMLHKDPMEQYPGVRYPGVRWFMDWFYPIYSGYGKGALLSKYFKVIADNYPKVNENTFDDNRQMNLGEFVHFWSGAAGADLNEIARTAWGKYWTSSVQKEFEKAKVDFPNVKY